ncbi:patatin-like phospholipase family protein [Glaciecola sp. MH2013]|uniref:patatin-like phospholipase family protein n=1 Tax=Glaciecola sp. MH2013 TaxID=2785524 RepID=UPI00189D57A5|nr:patatin-like phospholipase family protein [Glaciecola sp. MH2013]MBF7072980.1 patatin-like phospholipase family protein [Glaciecola sp. MH2013]
MSVLQISAGKKALDTIKKEGWSSDLFGAFLGASGGPKWFVLAGLDKVMFSEFLDKRSSPIDVMGSSAGAFRAACFSQTDSAAAIERLATHYSTTVYSEKPGAQEITAKGYELLGKMLGPRGIEESLSQQYKNTHFFVQHCHGLVASENKLAQMAGLSVAAAKNALNRRGIAKHFTRAVFSVRPNTQLFSDPEDFPTDFYELTHQNYVPALMASGSIPVVLEGIKDIPGAKSGMYRDGGIIDYHFDLQISTNKLVMYPHFYNKPIPGWFDKNLKKRRCHNSSYDNVVMLSPSAEFVSKLPYGKIPDRKDFETMPAEQRISYWRKVISESDRLAEAFLALVSGEQGLEQISPLILDRK